MTPGCLSHKLLKLLFTLVPQEQELPALKVVGSPTHGGWFNTRILFWECLLEGPNWSHQPGQQGAGGR